MASIINPIITTILNETRHVHREEEHSEEEHGEESSPTVAKATAMGVLFLASFTLGLLPIKLSQWFHWESNPKNNKIVILLLCFGGGVLLCTTFLHLVPEVAENIEALQEDGKIPELSFHLAELLMCIGFFVMYFVEEMVHHYLHKRERRNELAGIRRSLSIRRGDFDEVSAASTNDVSNFASTENIVKAENGINNSPNGFDHTHNHSHNHGGGHSHIVLEDSLVRSIRGLLIVLALSVHELFEGLAVGLEDEASHVWYMFGAVSAHKLVIAFCIGVELITNKTKTVLIIVYVFTFAVVSPMGIGIGIAISENGTDNTALPSMILQGLASGTLLYVVFFEILQKDRKGGLSQWLAVLVGFLVMFGLSFVGK